MRATQLGWPRRKRAASATPIFVRLTRGQVMSVKVEDYVEAARAMGNPRWRIALFHILPNIMPPIIVLFTNANAANTRLLTDTQIDAAVHENAAIRSTADFREGISSFLEKRKPVWRGDSD